MFDALLERMNETIVALGTQYQISVRPRYSSDAPTKEQLELIENAHECIESLLQGYKELQLEVERLRLMGHNCD